MSILGIILLFFALAVIAGVVTALMRKPDTETDTGLSNDEADEGPPAH